MELKFNRFVVNLLRNKITEVSLAVLRNVRIAWMVNEIHLGAYC